MKKVFVAYANDKMAYALERIGKQANALGIFDEVILYRPEMLPDYVRNSVLMQYSYGGGLLGMEAIHYLRDTSEKRGRNYCLLCGCRCNIAKRNRVDFVFRAYEEV